VKGRSQGRPFLLAAFPGGPDPGLAQLAVVSAPPTILRSRSGFRMPFLPRTDGMSLMQFVISEDFFRMSIFHGYQLHTDLRQRILFGRIQCARLNRPGRALYIQFGAAR
jgi:hypothetical protein